MLKVKKKILLSLIIIFLITAIFAGSASAYILGGQRWIGNSAGYVFNSTVPDAWKTQISYGASNWNGWSKFNFYNSAYALNGINAVNKGYYNGWVAYTTPVGGTYLSSVSLTFNTYYPFSTNGSGGTYDIQSIAVHEFGHWLVLNDEYDSGNESNVMWWSGPPGEIKRYPTADDVAGIRAIYGI